MEIIFDNIGLESDMLKLEEEDCWRDFFFVLLRKKRKWERLNSCNLIVRLLTIEDWV